jgi:predicted lipoprotein with Yx(FWY)xxD motif
VIRASRAAYLVCGVLTALALAGWGVRAAGAPQNNTASNAASNATVPLAAPNNQAPAANNGDAAANTGDAANNGDAAAGNGAAADNGDSTGGNGGAAAAVGTKTTRLVGKNVPKMGDAVFDDQGFTLYRFDKDTVNPPTSNCKDKCAQVWPPVSAAEGNLPQLEGIDQSLVGTIQRADGGTQLTIAGWPIYRYIGDKAPGKWTGQGVGKTWFVIKPDGKKNLSCLSAVPPKAVEPPSSGDANSGSSGGGY